MTTCPLPVDWLDLLEGRPSVAARAHLDDCASCRAVVAALTDGLPDPPLIPQRVGGATTHVRAVFDDVTDPVIVEGQQRWLTVDGADVRLPVLVLGLVDEDSGSADLDDAGAETTAADGTSMPSLVDIVPLWTDRENATSADLLLDESDTTTGVAWRAAFRRQTTVPADLLTDLFGSLTMTGEAAVAHALAGRLPPERTGAELESEFDPRLTADEWMTDVLYRAVERVEEPGDPLVTGRFRSPARTPAPPRRDDTQIDVAATTAPDPPGDARGPNICVSSRASIGGAAAAGGATFQDEVFAWACAAMVAEQPLPTPMPPDAVVRVGAQTGYEVDDVAIETAADGLVLCQVKAHLALGEPSGSPLADALDQVVAQCLVGVRGRPVTPGRDMLVIVTDADAPRTVRSHLATAISRTATQPPGTPFGDELTGPEARALEIALAHIRRSWTARRGTPSEEDLRRLLSVMAVVAVDTVDGGRYRATAQTTIRGFVPPGEEWRAWDALVAVGREVAIAREWRSRPELVTAVARHGIIVGPGPSVARDIALLRTVTQSNLVALQASTTLPVGGGIHLFRHADNDLAAARPADGGVLVVGEAGSGKTGVLVTFAAGRSECGQDIVVLRATDLAAGTVSVNTRLALPIDHVLLSWTGASPATLVIDALDAARGSTARARLAELVGALAESRWRVVASVRTFDLMYGPGLRAAFTGEPVSSDAARRDSRLDGIRHIRVDDLTEAELDPLTTSATPVAGFYAAASADLRALLRNPFNLRLASELLAPGVAISRLARQWLTSAKTRLDLLAAYWEHRIDQDVDTFARADLLTRIAVEMLRSRQLRVLAAAPTVEATHSGALTGLLSDNVLAEEDRSGTAARRVLIFSHHILFDYTSMRCVLRNPLDELQLLQRLDADPALPLVARPSLDMLFDDLWQAIGDRRSYWQLALALAASPHLLASLPAAARLVAAGPSVEDLLPLAAACKNPDPNRRNSGYAFLSQITGAIRASVTPEAAVTTATAALARLAADLSDAAKKGIPTWQCLGSVVDLLNALQLRRPLMGTQPGAADRARAVVNVLDACRIDAVQFERLAVAVSEHLKAAIAADAAQAGAVTRLLDDANALPHWGGQVLAQLVTTIPELARSDAALARRVAEAAWTFQEIRDESVDFGGPLLPIAFKRGQAADHARWQLGEIFSELCREDLLTATAIFTDIVDAGTTSAGHAHDAALWPLALGDAQGWLASYSPDLETLGGEAVPAMARALRDALADAATRGSEPAPIMVMLVTKMHNASAWADLLTPEANANGLAAAFLPLLMTGSLLAHPDTHEAAGTLLRALAAHADDESHARLESAVRAAGERATGAGRRRPERIVDELLGCLDPTRVTGDAEKDRLTSLAEEGGPPPLTPRPQVASWFTGRETLLERLAEKGTTLGTPLATAIGALDEAVALAGTDGPAEAIQAVRQRIPELFLAADGAGAADPAALRPIRLLMTEAAAMLAGDVNVVPGTLLARRVVDMLLQAATSDDAGRMLS